MLDWLFLTNSVLLGVGLAMDAFSVSLANGLHEPRMSGLRMAAIAGVYAFFQAFMPMTGWGCVHSLVLLFSWLDALIPWIALLLLLWIGGSMVREGLFSDCEGEEVKAMGAGVLFLQGVATSIDALSVGFTIADYQCQKALACSLIIAAVTFVFCVAGLAIGRHFGTRLQRKATILGGVILIGIGFEIWISRLFF